MRRIRVYEEKKNAQMIMIHDSRKRKGHRTENFSWKLFGKKKYPTSRGRFKKGYERPTRAGQMEIFKSCFMEFLMQRNRKHESTIHIPRDLQVCLRSTSKYIFLVI